MDQEVAKTLGELELKLQELERELTSIGHRETPQSQPHAPGKLIDEAVERNSEGRVDIEQDDEDERSVDNAFGGPAVFGGEEVPAQGDSIKPDSAFPVSETAYGEIATASSPPTSSFPSGVFSPAPYTPQPGQPLTPPGPSPRPPLPPPLPQPGPTPQPPASPPGPTPQPPASPPAPPPHPSSTPSGPTPSSTPSGFYPHTPPPGPPFVPASAPQVSPSLQPLDVGELIRFKEKMRQTLEDLIDEYSRLLSPKPPA